MELHTQPQHAQVINSCTLTANDHRRPQDILDCPCGRWAAHIQQSRVTQRPERVGRHRLVDSVTTKQTQRDLLGQRAPHPERRCGRSSASLCDPERRRAEARRIKPVHGSLPGLPSKDDPPRPPQLKSFVEQAQLASVNQSRRCHGSASSFACRRAAAISSSSVTCRTVAMSAMRKKPGVGTSPCSNFLQVSRPTPPDEAREAAEAPPRRRLISAPSARPSRFWWAESGGRGMSRY